MIRIRWEGNREYQPQNAWGRGEKRVRIVRTNLTHARPMLSRGSRLLLAAVFLGSFYLDQSCAKSDRPTYEIQVKDGVKVVHNFSRSPDKVFRDLKFVEDLSIGVEEGDEDYVFDSPTDIDADRNGNIYVLDSGDCVVKKFGPDGRYLRQFGGRGQGPGEFQRPRAIFVSDQDKIFVGDGEAAEIEEFALSGDYLKTRRVDLPRTFCFNRDGDLLVEQYVYDDQGKSFLAVGSFDFESQTIRPFFRQRQYWPARVMDDRFFYEFPYFVRWVVNSHDSVYVGSAEAYEISVFDSQGRLQFRFNKEFDPIPVRGEERKTLLERLGRSPARAEENPYKENPVYPVFKDISRDEKDRVWVGHYQPGWRFITAKETRYDVFSGDGIFLFSTRIPGHIYPQLKFKNGYLYSLRKDDSGYSKAVRVKVTEKDR
jgi:hypothetical protein